MNRQKFPGFFQGHRNRRKPPKRSLIEILELRALMTADLTPTFTSLVPPGQHFNYVIYSQNPDALSPDGSVTPPASAFNPATLKSAYGINLITDGGVLQDGTGMTIAIIDAFDNPHFVSRNSSTDVNLDTSFLASDLHKFDVQYGLPEPPGFFTKVDQSGGTSYPVGDTGWGTEIALDVEWVHAIAPGAKIVLVEAADNSDTNLILNAASWARDFSGAAAITMSFGRSESSALLDSVFHSPADHGVTWLASTGDYGAPGSYPAYSPNVVAVGGTTLTAPGGVYGSESAWSGSGGGLSVYETQPSYQSGLVIHNGGSIISSGGKRATPDISIDADPASGVAVYDSYSQGSATPWLQVGGTSLSSPVWAALVAIVDEIRADHGRNSLDGATEFLPSLYDTHFTSDYHDITTGSNGYSAGPGYDLTTGLGTPKADTLIRKLAGVNFSVDSSTPAINGVVSTPPTSFVIKFSDAVDPASLQGSDLTVNSIAATGVSLSSDDKTATFTFGTSPVVSQGLQTMAMANNAVTKLGDATTGLASFSATFRYDVLTLQVTSTSPSSPTGAFSLPGPFTYDVNFNEVIDPTSVQTSDLTLSGIAGATVSNVTVLPGNTTARFTLSGITAEGALNTTIAAGAMTDQYGNPGAAFSGSYSVDIGTIAIPTPLTAVNPLGSLVYNSTATGYIGVGDSDTFTLSVNPSQTITVLVTPTSPGLQPTLQLLDPSNAVIGSATATAAGQNAVLETIAATAAGTYSVVVAGVGATTGNYSVQIILNAALETETSLSGPSNDSLASAQSIDGSMINLGPSNSVRRGAVIGANLAGTTTYSTTDFESGQAGYVINNNIRGTGTSAGLWHLSTRRGSEVGHSSTTSFYYGSDSTGTYSTGAGNAGSITSPAIQLAAGGPISVSFDYVLQTEGNGPWDQATVQVSANGFASFTTIASSTNASQLPLTSTWRSASFDLSSFAGQTVQIRFSFDTLDSGANNYEGWYVDDVQVSTPGTWKDYYSVSLNAGDSVSVALKNLSGSGAVVSLLNPAGNPIASGVPSANLDQAISNIAVSSTGTYYLLVSGQATVSYDLLVTENAAFDTEPNSSLGTSQSLSSDSGALGYVSGSSSLFDLTGPVISGPVVLSGSKITLGLNTDGSFITGDTGIRYNGTEFVALGTPVASFTVGYNGATYTNNIANDVSQITGITIQNLSSGSLKGVRIVGMAGSNVKVERIVMFNQDDDFVTIATRLTNLSGSILANVASLENLDPDQMNFSTSNDVVLGNKFVRATAPSNGLTIGLGSQDSRSVVSAEGFDNRNPFDIINSPVDPNGASGDIGIAQAFNFGSLAAAGQVAGIAIMAFGTTAAAADAVFTASSAGSLVSDPDWYSFTVADTSALHFETRTPSDGPGQFPNTLNPHLELYDPAGNLVASGIAKADGRNEVLQYTPTVTGTYRIKVSSEGNTAGEYALLRDLFSVVSSSPMSGETVSTPPTNFVINFSDAIDPTSLQASDLTVNSITADHFALSPDNKTATFTFDASPVTVQGLETMSMAVGAVTKLGEPTTTSAAFSSTFRYDAVLLGVTSTNPPSPNGVFNLPSPFTYDVQFNEAINPTSVQASDLMVSGIPGASVSNVTVLPGNTTVRFTLTGITSEGNLTTALAAGAITDQFGNAGAGFSGTYLVDIGTLAFPTPLTGHYPSGSLIYSATTSGLIGFSGDLDSFTLKIDPGQKATIIVTPSSPSLQPTVTLLDPSNAGIGGATATGAGQPVILQSVAATTGGTYTIGIGDVGGTTGGYTVQVLLNASAELEGLLGGVDNNSTATAQPLDSSMISLGTPGLIRRGAVEGTIATTADQDYYSVNLAAGDTLSVALRGSNSDLTAQLRSSDGTTVLATTIAGATNLDSSLTDFSVTVAGTYYLVIGGATGGETYDAVITRNAEFGTESNDTILQAQELLSRQVSGNQWVLGYIGAGNSSDLYKVNVAGGATITLQTYTPADGSGEFVNLLDPRVRILDSAGNQVAINDNGAGDGKNALLNFTNAGPASTFYVEVSSTLSSTTQGEYELRIAGNTVTLPSFHVSGIDPTDGVHLRIAPTSMTVHFNDNLLLTSIAASDLKVDGISATGITIQDNETVVFTLPTGLAEGSHTITIAAGAIADVQNTGIDAFTGSFVLDLTAPRVVATSIGPNQVVAPGSVSYQVTFSEAMLAANLSADDFNLHGVQTRRDYAADSFTFDASGKVLTISYSNLPEDKYSLSLIAGANGSDNFTDLAGNALDGEFTGTFPSGNGVSGGDFKIGFTADASNEAFPLPLSAHDPAGSLIYSTSLTRSIVVSGVTDKFTLAVDAGQTISVLVTPNTPSLKPMAQLLDPLNTIIAGGSATAAGRNALLQTVTATSGGTYTVAVGGAASTTGSYTVEVILNAALESESYLFGSNNDTLANAQSLDGSLISLTPGGSVKRGAVEGGNGAAVGVDSLTDFEAGQDGYVVNNNIRGTGNAAGLWHLTSNRAYDPGHSPYTSFYYGNEFTDNYDTGAANAGTITSPSITIAASGETSLSFNYLLQTEGDSSAYDLAKIQVSNNGGASFITLASSADSSQLPQSSTWRKATFDLSAFAGQSIQIRFSFDTVDATANSYEGWYVDDVEISPHWSDYYSVHLNTGDRASIGLKNTSGTTDTALSLLDSAGNVIAVGAATATNLDLVANNIAIPTSGIYYVKVSGQAAATYNVVVTENAALDAEPNDTLAGAQDITGVHGVLGHIGGDSVETAVLGAVGQGWWDNSGFQYSGNQNYFTGRDSYSIDHNSYYVFDLSTLSLPVTGAHLQLYNPDYYSSDPTENLGIFDVSTPISVLETGGSGQTDIFNDLGSGANYGNQSVSLADDGQYVDITLNDLAIAAINANYGGQIAFGGSLTTLSGSAPQFIFGGTGYGGVQLVVALGEPVDWYSIDVASGTRLLEFQTSTPGDGSGGFGNALDPGLELYDPAGNLVASGVATADGRNESINFQPSVAGTYYVRVAGQSDTKGEYFLNTKSFLSGDLNQDGVVDTGDLGPLMAALRNQSTFQQSANLTSAEFLALADVNRDGYLSNSDLQAFLNLLRSAPSPSNSPANVNLIVNNQPVQHSYSSADIGDSGSAIASNKLSESNADQDTNPPQTTEIEQSCSVSNTQTVDASIASPAAATDSPSPISVSQAELVSTTSAPAIVMPTSSSTTGDGLDVPSQTTPAPALSSQIIFNTRLLFTVEDTFSSNRVSQETDSVRSFAPQPLQLTPMAVDQALLELRDFRYSRLGEIYQIAEEDIADGTSADFFDQLHTHLRSKFFMSV